MQRWLAAALAAAVLIVTAGPAWCADNMTIKGVIDNWGKVKAKLPQGAYLQLVKIEEKMSGTDDAQGLSAFDSKFPRIPVRDDGSFRVEVKDLPSGDYIVALQRAMPRAGSGTPLLITADKNPLIIKVPGASPLDVGKVDVGILPAKQDAPAK